jgi:hypothetical protein
MLARLKCRSKLQLSNETFSRSQCFHNHGSVDDIDPFPLACNLKYSYVLRLRYATVHEFRNKLGHLVEREQVRTFYRGGNMKIASHCRDRDILLVRYSATTVSGIFPR